jgi:hypothetical protein
MAELILPEHVLQKLEEIAKRENRTPAEVVEQMVTKNTTEETASTNSDALVASALRANIHTGEIDVAERSREILNTEYATYLKQRMEQNSDDTSR